MKIFLGNLTFSDIKEFTDYLVAHYEQDKLLTQDVHLEISYDGMESENKNHLLQFLQMPERSRNYKINVTPQPLNLEQSAFDQLLAQVYVTNKMQKKNTEGSESTVMSVRKAKKNWVEGKKEGRVGYQVQLNPQQFSVHSKSKRNDPVHVFNMEQLPLVAGSEALLKNVTRIMSKSKLIIEKKDIEVSSLIHWLNLLLNNCQMDNENNLSRFLVLIEKLGTTNNQILKLWIKIHTALGEQADSEHLGLLLDIQEGLEKHSTLLNSIAALFTYQPYPDLKQFVLELAKDKKNLKTYIESFDTDPGAVRASVYDKKDQLIKSSQQILKQQFDTSQVHRVITKMQSLDDGESVSTELRYKLAQQVTYINAIGLDHSLSVGSKTYTNLTKMSRAELNELSGLLIALARLPALDEQSKLSRQKALLNLLAVMREMHFRATGEFIDSTQILSILISLYHSKHNMLMELGPEEKRSGTTQILAAIQWVIADGGTIDVCVANRDSLTRDYLERGANFFFASLGIPSAAVIADKPTGTYQVGGINYTTIADMAYYRSRAKAEGEVLTAIQFDRTLANNLILNGLDGTTLENRTSFDYRVNAADNVPGHQQHPYAWIYLLINEFINQNEFRNLDDSSGNVWSEEADLEHLKLFLEQKAPTESHKQQLKGLSLLKLNTWINQACKTQQLVEGEDFLIDSTNASTKVAVPVYQKVPQESFIFSKEMHYFLHARLQQQYPSERFEIGAEGVIGDSVSSKDLFDDYKQQGRIVGIFGRLGTSEDLVKQRNVFNVGIACKIPAHEHHRPKEIDLHPLAFSTAYLDKIKQTIARANAEQPIILLAQDAHRVRELFKVLSEQFTKEGKTIQLGAFTGDESEVDRRNWAANKAGQPNSITIATSPLIKDIKFDTNHEHRFLGIHTFIDTPKRTRSFIDKISPENESGQYIAIYENDGIVVSSSWTYQSEQHKKNILNVVRKIKSKKNQEEAAEQYYTQSVSQIQMTVLQQFEEWKELLHLIYPQNEWKKLDLELFTLREELIVALTAAWGQRLESSDPSEKVLKEFEQAANSIWKSKREMLKSKAESKVQVGSINELRCKYLEGVSLEEQLKLNKLAQRQKRKAATLDKKKVSRIVESGLDVNGSMLAYSDVSLENYRINYVKNRLKVLALDVTQEITRSSLRASMKTILIERLGAGENFLALAGVLHEYFTLSDSNNAVERYRMQPAINELIRIYEYAGLPQSQTEAQELEKLKDIYINNVAFDIIETLEQGLSWSLEQNRGFGLTYWLERTAVKKAANELLSVVEEVKNTTDTPTRKLAIKKLYKLLAHHQAQLEGLWIFSFGHKNTRDLINETLKTLDSLTVMGSGFEQLNEEFIAECKEEGLSEVMKNQFNGALQQIEKQNTPWLVNHPQWNDIKQQILLIQAENKTVYAIEDLYYLLSKVSNELNLSHVPANAPLLKPVVALRGELRSIWEKFYQQHHEMISETKQFKIKAEKLQENIQGLMGYRVKSVHINYGHNGLSEYYDVVIEGAGSCPLFDSFLSYNSRFPELDEARDVLINEKEQVNTQIIGLKKLQNDLLPLSNSRQNTILDMQLFPEGCHEQVRELLALKEFDAGKLPTDIRWFSEEELELFHDRNIVNNLSATKFTLEQIDTLKDRQLKSAFIELFNKINGVTPSPKQSFFSRMLSYMVTSGLPKETSEDWSYQFAHLQTVSDHRLRDLLQSKINKTIDTISSHLASLESTAVAHLEGVTARINFFHQRIKDEGAKTGVITKRFDTLDKLYEFEIEVRNFKVNQLQSQPKQENPVPRATFKPVEVPPSFEADESDMGSTLPSKAC